MVIVIVLLINFTSDASAACFTDVANVECISDVELMYGFEKGFGRFLPLRYHGLGGLEIWAGLVRARTR